MIRLAHVLILVISIALTVSGHSQEVIQNTTFGDCSPIFSATDQSMAATVRCVKNFGPSITYRIDGANSAFLAKYFAIDAVAVSNLMDQVNAEHVVPYQLSARLVSLVDELKYLREQVTSYGDLEAAQDIVIQLHQSLDAMDLDRSKILYRGLIAKFEEISKKQNSMENLVNIADANSQLGRLELASHEYDEAYSSFRSALDVIPGRFETEIIQLRVDIAEAAKLGSKHLDEVDRLLDEAIFYTKDLSLSNPTLYLRALQLKIMRLNERGDYEGSLDLLQTELLPLLPKKNDEAVFDVKNTTLCLSCIAHAANSLERYQDALDIATLAADSYDAHLLSMAPELEPLFINRSIALDALDRHDEAAGDRKHALAIAQHNAPDGLDPAYPYIWLNFGVRETNPDLAIEFMKKALVATAQNYALSYESFGDLIATAVGTNAGVMCFHGGGDMVGTVGIAEPPLFDFDPDNCDGFTYMDAGLHWSTDDITDVESRISTIFSKFIESPEETTVSALLTLCTELIVAGFQKEGADLCRRQMPVAISKRYLNLQSAEAAFRLSQFSHRAGYDFGISDDTLYRFALDAYAQSAGEVADYTQDAALSYAMFLRDENNSHELEVVLASQSAAVLASKNATAKQYWKARLEELSSYEAQSAVPKRSVFASAEDFDTDEQ